MDSRKPGYVRLLVGFIAMASLWGSEVPAATGLLTLDGASEELFLASRDALLAARTPEDRFRYAIAEMVVVTSMPCGASTEPISDPSLNAALGPIQVSPKACRAELNGKSFDEVIAEAVDIKRRDPTSLRVLPAGKGSSASSVPAKLTASEVVRLIRAELKREGGPIQYIPEAQPTYDSVQMLWWMWLYQKGPPYIVNAKNRKVCLRQAMAPPRPCE